MRLGNREPRSSDVRRRGAFRPEGEGLEGRVLLAIDLGANTPPTLPNIARNNQGIEMASTTFGAGAGFTVSDVGDLLGTGFDDFVASAPTVVNQGGSIVPGGGVPTVYLIFGSQATQTNGPSVISDWLNNTPSQRVGNLNQLGNSPNTQTNPVDGTGAPTNYPFDGIKIITSQQIGSQLGASVAQAGVINGRRAFLLGAPGGLDANGQNAGTGRAYLIYGGTALQNVTNKTLDLDNLNQNSGVSVITFVNTSTGAQTGRGVAGVGDVITDGLNDIAIGAPAATVNGLPGAGAVYLVSGPAIPTATSTVTLSRVGQTGGIAGVLFAGATAGAQAGFSVAGAGNVNGALTGANQSIQDLLIGAPAATVGPGAAYLVYGATNLPSLATTTNGVTSIVLNRVGATTSTVPGLTINGTANGDLTGFAVSSAGDFDGDGLSDILVGSPGWNNAAGRADLIYGRPVTGGPLSGTTTLDQLITNSLSASFQGATAGNLTGFSVSLVGKIGNTKGNPVIIGAPGFANAAGTAYLIPAHPGQLLGTFNLTFAETQPVAATQLTLTNPIGLTPSFFGASVSGRLIQQPQAHTGDSDLVSDFIIGAPGYSVTTPGLNNAGAAFILEGARVPVQTPVSTLITTQIGVEKAFGPFNNINPTTPATMQIFVFSNAAVSPPFAPVTQIDPTTVVVNGVAFPNATIAKDPVDENNDGIPDAIITITPRANIGLTAATTSLTISGRTLASSANPNKRWTGTAAITVSGAGPSPGPGPGPGPGGGGTVLQAGFIFPTAFLPPLGPTTYVPSLTTLSQYSSYKPIPYRVAINQYLPDIGFQQRISGFYGTGKHQNLHRSLFTSAIPHAVFHRGKWDAGDVFNFTHKEHVIPVNLQTERLGAGPVRHHKK
jgi:hypothetical protein